MTLLYGLVLCGGKSTRLGFPKFNIEKEGIPLYKWWTNTLNSFCKKTYISCQASQKDKIDYDFILEDESIDAGPLEGIHRAFQINEDADWLVVACDLVYINSRDINYLIENNREYFDAICFQNLETAEPFSLFTIYNSKIKGALEKEYLSDLKSAKRLLMYSNAIKLLPVNLNIIKGINTPEDYEIWKNHF